CNGSVQDLALALARHGHDIVRQPLAANLDFDLLARLHTGRYAGHGYGHAHGGRHGAAGDHTFATGGTHLHGVAHYTAFAQAQAHHDLLGRDALDGLATNELALRVFERDSPAQTGDQRVDVFVHFMAIQVHAGFQAQRVARAQAAGAYPRLHEIIPQRLDFTRRHYHFKTVFTGVARACDHDISLEHGCGKRLERFGRGAPLRANLPEPLTRLGALHRQHRKIATRVDGDVAAQTRGNALNPFDIGLRCAGVHDQAPRIGAEVVDNEIVDDTATLVEHARVDRLARLGEPLDVVGQQRAQEGLGIGPFDVDIEHVRHVEHTGSAAHRVVFLDLRTVSHGHVPAAEIDHAGAGGDVCVV